jgi:hypothetical protein
MRRRLWLAVFQQCIGTSDDIDEDTINRAIARANQAVAGLCARFPLRNQPGLNFVTPTPLGEDEN